MARAPDLTPPASPHSTPKGSRAAFTHRALFPDHRQRVNHRSDPLLLRLSSAISAPQGSEAVEGTDAVAAAQSSQSTTKRGIDTGWPEAVADKFDITSYRHASTILKYDFPAEYSNMVNVLTTFTLPYSQVVVGGGGKG